MQHAVSSSEAEARLDSQPTFAITTLCRSNRRDSRKNSEDRHLSCVWCRWKFFQLPALGMSTNGFKAVVDIDLPQTFNT